MSVFPRSIRATLAIIAVLVMRGGSVLGDIRSQISACPELGCHIQLEPDKTYVESEPWNLRGKKHVSITGYGATVYFDFKPDKQPPLAIDASGSTNLHFEGWRMALTSKSGRPEVGLLLARNTKNQSSGGHHFERWRIQGWYRKAAIQEDAQAQNDIGWILVEGKGVSPDYEQAVTWLRKAAEQDHAKAQLNIGWMYKEGKGVKQDYQQALFWFRKASEKGQVKAQFNIGHIYKNGLGVTPDFAEAIKWYRKAAEQGFAPAQESLGWMYAKGLGIRQDYAGAFKWYHEAAEQGYSKAQVNIGLLYKNGLGIEQNYDSAVKWLRLATVLGNTEAQNNLAWILATCPRSTIRDGVKAVQLAEGNLQKRSNDIYFLNTLAAAYAEVGRFNAAEATQLKALSMVKKDLALLTLFRTRLKSYKEHKPWRED